MHIYANLETTGKTSFRSQCLSKLHSTQTKRLLGAHSVILTTVHTPPCKTWYNHHQTCRQGTTVTSTKSIRKQRFGSLAAALTHLRDQCLTPTPVTAGPWLDHCYHRSGQRGPTRTPGPCLPPPPSRPPFVLAHESLQLALQSINTIYSARLSGHPEMTNGKTTVKQPDMSESEGRS